MTDTSPVVHIGWPDGDHARCGMTGEVVPWTEALTSEGRHFNCVDCHKSFTGGRAHLSYPEVGRD